MTMAFIIIYVVIALILVALINLVVVKTAKKVKTTIGTN